MTYKRFTNGSKYDHIKALRFITELPISRAKKSRLENYLSAAMDSQYYVDIALVNEFINDHKGGSESIKTLFDLREFLIDNNNQGAT